jgi:hypothetical protein
VLAALQLEQFDFAERGQSGVRSSRGRRPATTRVGSSTCGGGSGTGRNGSTAPRWRSIPTIRPS